jgi:hypothetical protein
MLAGHRRLRPCRGARTLPEPLRPIKGCIRTFLPGKEFTSSESPCPKGASSMGLLTGMEVAAKGIVRTLRKEGAMKYESLIGTVLTVGTLAGAALAASPTKADMDFCNMKAAEVSKGTPVQPGTTATRQPAPSSTPPGTPVSPGTTAQPAPGTGSPQPGSNPSGGRITDSSPPGISPSQLGMDPIGETDQGYRQAYLSCIADRTK